jgi:nucleotide-binding universal stress UspA family protein
MEASAGRIVVGTDGSDASVDALKWAARQAQLTGATLEVVTTWHYPVSYGFPTIADVDWQQGAKLTQEHACTAAGLPDDLPLVSTVVEGHPAYELVGRSYGADLLVVGSRGHGGFTGMLVGSVSGHVVAHASCPVVVVRHHQEGEAD